MDYNLQSYTQNFYCIEVRILTVPIDRVYLLILKSLLWVFVVFKQKVSLMSQRNCWFEKISLNNIPSAKTIIHSSSDNSPLGSSVIWKTDPWYDGKSSKCRDRNGVHLVKTEQCLIFPKHGLHYFFPNNSSLLLSDQIPFYQNCAPFFS